MESPRRTYKRVRAAYESGGREGALAELRKPAPSLRLRLATSPPPPPSSPASESGPGVVGKTKQATQAEEDLLLALALEDERAFEQELRRLYGDGGDDVDGNADSDSDEELAAALSGLALVDEAGSTACPACPGVLRPASSDCFACGQCGLRVSESGCVDAAAKLARAHDEHAGTGCAKTRLAPRPDARASGAMRLACFECGWESLVFRGQT